MTNWADPKYKLAIEHAGIKFYTLANTADYHVSRFLAASANDRYASLGLTPEFLEAIENEILAATEAKKWDEVAVWVHNLKARRTNPVDELAALRMAAIYYFLEDEDPDKVESQYTDIKISYMKQYPELFSFFLLIGLQYTPSYTNYLEQITPTFLEQRAKVIQALSLPSRLLVPS